MGALAGRQQECSWSVERAARVLGVGSKQLIDSARPSRLGNKRKVAGGRGDLPGVLSP